MKSIHKFMRAHLEQGAAAGDTGPIREELDEYYQKGRVIAPVVGSLTEIPPGTLFVTD